MSGLLALAERCEAAAGSDRELVAAVMAQLFERKSRFIGVHYTDGRRAMSKVWVDPTTGKWVGTHARQFTASLDDATTLVGSNCLFTTRQLWDGPQRAGYAHVSLYRDDAEECDGKRHLEDFYAIAATPALALTAAALRARAAEIPPPARPLCGSLGDEM